MGQNSSLERVLQIFLSKETKREPPYHIPYNPSRPFLTETKIFLIPVLLLRLRPLQTRPPIASPTPPRHVVLKPIGHAEITLVVPRVDVRARHPVDSTGIAPSKSDIVSTAHVIIIPAVDSARRRRRDSHARPATLLKEFRAVVRPDEIVGSVDDVVHLAEVSGFDERMLDSETATVLGEAFFGVAIEAKANVGVAGKAEEVGGNFVHVADGRAAHSVDEAITSDFDGDGEARLDEARFVGEIPVEFDRVPVAVFLRRKGRHKDEVVRKVRLCQKQKNEIV